MTSTLTCKTCLFLFFLGIGSCMYAQNPGSNSVLGIYKNKLNEHSLRIDSARMRLDEDSSSFSRNDTLIQDSNRHLWQRIPKPKYQARFAMEGYHTTFQNPRVLNEPQYLRVQGNASISWLGLPLLVDFYRTTESQTFYNSNYFKVQFDHEAYITGIKQAWQKKLGESTNQLNASQIKKQQSAKAEQALEKQKEELLTQQDKLQKSIEQKSFAYKEKYSPKADSLYNSYYDSVNGEINERKDSAELRAQRKAQRVKDSSDISRLEKDSQRVAARIRNVQEKYEEYKERRASLDSLISADSAKLLYYQKLLEDPKGNAANWLKENGLPKQLVFLSYLKDFEVGLVNPMIHPYSISGIGMRGIGTSIGKGKSECKLTGGKAIISDMNYYNRSNSNYERLFIGTSYNYKLNKNTSILLFGHHAQDPVKKLSKEGRTAFQNSNFGWNLLAHPINIAKIDASFAISHYQTLNNAITSISYPGNSNISKLDHRKARSAYHIRLERSLTKWVTLEVSDQFVGPGFKNLGNPFMRTNFREQQAKTRLGLFKKQVQLTGFYKQMRDNPLNLGEVTNTTSGYGMALQTRFQNKKLPNFMGSLSPYEQGNNHPDSLFRTQSKYSILTGGMTYRLGKRRLKYFLMAYGSQSVMQFNDSFTAKVHTVSVNQDFAIGKHITVGIGSTFVRTFPAVDSTQVNVWQARLGYVTKKGSNLMISSQYSQYLNAAFRKGAAVSLSIPMGKTFKLTAKAAYDHYYKLWGMKDQKAWSGLVRLEVKL